MDHKLWTLPEHMGLQALLVAYLLFVEIFVWFGIVFILYEGIALFVVFLYLVCSMLPVSLGCSFVIALSVFS